jgi:hypothetical protein
MSAFLLKGLILMSKRSQNSNVLSFFQSPPIKFGDCQQFNGARSMSEKPKFKVASLTYYLGNQQ